MEPIDQSYSELMPVIPLYTEQAVTTTSSLPTADPQSESQPDQQSLMLSSSSTLPSTLNDFHLLPQVPLHQRYLSYAPVQTVTQSRKPRIKRPNPVIFDDKSVTSGAGYETGSNPSQSNRGGATKVPKKRGPKPGSHHQSNGGSVTSSGIGYHASKRPRGRPPLAIKKEPVPLSFTSMPPPTATRSSDAGIPFYGYYSSSVVAPSLTSSARQPRPPWAVSLHRLLSLLASQGPLSSLDLGRRLPGVPRDMLQGALEFLLASGIVEGHRVKAPEGGVATTSNVTVPVIASISNNHLPAGGTAIYALARNATRGPPLMFPPEINFEEGQEGCHNQELTFFLQRLACQGSGHNAELEELERIKARLERLQQLESELMSLSAKGERTQHLSSGIRALVDKEPQLAHEPLYRAVLAVLPPVA